MLIYKIKMNNYEFISYKKILIFGIKNVGKSCLITKMERNKFEEEYKPSEKSKILTIIYLIRNSNKSFKYKNSKQ